MYRTETNKWRKESEEHEMESLEVGAKKKRKGKKEVKPVDIAG